MSVLATSSSTTTSPTLQVQQMPRQPTPKGSNQSLSPLNFSPGPGARPPVGAGGSMPSSPTSIHSSSSAIFERDIEIPLKNANSGLSPNHAPLAGKDPHHTARAIAHESLENAVPSVLTAAVAALGEGSSKDGAKRGSSFDEISVIAPVPLSTTSTMSTGPGSRYGVSRSPSPHMLPLPLPGVAMTSSTSSGASTPGSSPSRMGSRQTTLPQRVASALAAPTSPTSPIVPGAFPPPTITTSLTPATDPPGHSSSLIESNMASRGSTPGIIGVVPPTPNANTYSFAAINGGTSPDGVMAGSPPSATASPLVVTPPLPVGTRRDNATSRSTSRPTSIAASLYDELSLAPLVITSGVDELVAVPPDVEPIALSGNSPHPPSSPHIQPTLRDNASATSAASKRLSFISYNDLLNSTPMSSFPLSNLTSPNATMPEPPHQIEVSVAGPKAGSRQSTINQSPTSDIFVPPLPAVDGNSMEDLGAPGNTLDMGGKGVAEWERGGFGTGLEERLEAAMKDQPAKE